jgi:hypothetical protein
VTVTTMPATMTTVAVPGFCRRSEHTAKRQSRNRHQRENNVFHDTNPLQIESFEIER